MRQYVGIDIGTTNMKCISLHEDGRTVSIAAEPTPVINNPGGPLFFDLAKIEAFVVAAIEAAKKDSVCGIGFSTIGESVVPLDESGRPLANPLMWYDDVTRSTETRCRDYAGLHDSLSRGVESGYTMGIYKMLWMMHGLVEASEVASWLPLSGYLAYRLTGVQAWDYSQASRTLLFDIHTRDWDFGLMDELGVRNGFSTPVSMGLSIGETSDHIPVFVGGHDHFVGLSGVRDLFGTDTLFSSMGSASVMGGIVTANPEQIRTSIRTIDDLIVGVPRDDGEYYVEMSLRYAGKLLEAIARNFGKSASNDFFDRTNIELGGRQPERSLLFMVEGDPIVQERAVGLNMLDVPIDVSTAEIVHSLYLYFAAMALTVEERLRPLLHASRVVAAGGVTRNRMLMQYIADGINFPVSVLPDVELSALGAALLAAGQNGGTGIYERVLNHMDIDTIQPNMSGGQTRERIVAYQERLFEKKASIQT